MTGKLSIKSAASVTLEELAASFNASFAEYFFPITLTPELLSGRVRLEQLDIFSSRLAYDRDRLVGMALLGLRRDVAWVGGFGITLEYRGRGRAHELMSALIEEARRLQARTLMLEVLSQNSAAIHLYERAGMTTARELMIYERGADASSPSASPTAQLHEATPAELLQHFRRLHLQPPAWQRDLPTLLAMDGMQGLYLGERAQPRAYALLREGPNKQRYIVDLAARSPEDADALCEGIVARVKGSLRIINEPESSIFCAALRAQGFLPTASQHEMRMTL
jgi:ribosomal protein S18 acetylase RimI-like enzyme